MDLILATLSIALIDLVLSGDNAAVIGLAIKNLPEKQRKSAAFIGAGGAIVLRVIFTALATILVAIPYLNAIGGVLLLWITWKLLHNEADEDCVKSCERYWSAVASIIVADLSMAFDNIMGVAGAAHGQIPLVIFGLALSIPILVIGSSWLATLMNRFPIIIYLGAGVLVHTALTMVVHDRALHLMQYVSNVLSLILIWAAACSVVLYGHFQIRQQEAEARSQFAGTREEEK